MVNGRLRMPAASDFSYDFKDSSGFFGYRMIALDPLDRDDFPEKLNEFSDI